MNLWVVFMTGLTTGGLSCLAVQGGLLASVIANQKEEEQEEKTAGQDWLPVTMFLLAKLVAHVGLGFLLGWLGSLLTISLGVRLFFQVCTAGFMFATAMNLLNVHPAFRVVAFTPPRFLRRAIRGVSKSNALFAPLVLGAMTVVIPCGVTQAMEVVAITSGDPVVGALIMGTFVLGTSPLFAFLGVATAKLSEAWHATFNKVAAYLLVAMAIYSLNGVLLVMNSPVTVNSLLRPVTWFFSNERFTQGTSVATINGVQMVTIDVTNKGYTPNYVKVARDVPVELTLRTNETYSCAVAFVFNEFDIDVFLEPTATQTFTFTPTKPGRFAFTCSMGMYSGVMEVL